jgi:DNA-binding NtrC family response regulator
MSKRRILIVDDDRLMVRTLRDILSLRGWETDGVHSGEEAVAAVRINEYAVVLMDVRMSGMTGVEALREMRALRPDLRVILMTAYAATELLAQAERDGALHVFPKPVELERLMDTLDAVIADARCVLIVDDDADFLRTLAELVAARGYGTLRAGTLDEALALLQAQLPGAVMLDLRLDGLEPRDNVLAIKSVSPAVALILYSGHPLALEQTTGSLPPKFIRGVLQKPFPPDRVFELLDAIFAG